MLSGRSRLPTRYDYDPAYMVKGSADEDGSLHWAEQVLRRSVVDREADMQIKNGNELLKAIDDVLERLRVGAQSFSGTRRCRVCGTGEYINAHSVPWTQLALSEPGGATRMRFFRCTDCRHVQHFVFEQQKLPKAWFD
jgi:hypothetical protein